MSLTPQENGALSSVERIAKEECWKDEDAVLVLSRAVRRMNAELADLRRQLSESQERERELIKTLAKVGVPLEVLVASDADQPIPELSPTLRRILREELNNLRAALQRTAREGKTE